MTLVCALDMANEQANKIQCVGFIMDGNRRWARGRDLPTVAGHQAGKEVFAKSVGWLREFGIAHGVYYGFSTENWKRSAEEVQALENLLQVFLVERLETVEQDKVRTRFIGRRHDWSAEIQEKMVELESASAEYRSLTVWVALSYGGRVEIVDAINKALQAGVTKLDEELFATYLDTSDMPEPDLIIRTGGEQRLSNFLTWQSVYSELYFTDTYWPDFTKEEFTRILDWYVSRERRRGR